MAKKEKLETSIYISTEGEVEVRTFNKADSYEHLRDAVEGWIECVRLESLGLDMWVNEEGKVYSLPVNGFATSLFFREFGVVDQICGNVILTGSDRQGDTIGLTKKQIENITSLLGYDYGELQIA